VSQVRTWISLRDALVPAGAPRPTSGGCGARDSVISGAPVPPARFSPIRCRP